MILLRSVALMVVTSLAAVVAVTALSAPASAWTFFPETSGDFRYVEQGTEARITGYVGPGGAVTVPETIEGLTVREIHIRAMDSSGITSVSLPSTVRSIGEEAFADNDITYVNVPAQLITIQTGAFANNRLEHIGLEVAPDLAYIGGDAFIDNRLEQVTIPSSVQRLESNAFANNDLTQFTVGGGAMEYFFPSAFDGQSRPGVIFAGWRDAASGGNVVDLNDPAVWDDPPRATYYAQYNDAHTVTFDTQAGGTNTTSEVLVPIGGSVAQPADPTRAHYDFDGWYDNGSGGAAWNFATTVPGDMTLYAQWTPLDYTVIFAGDGDPIPAAQTVTYPATITEPADPAREHHTFSGWVDDSDQPWDFDAPLDADRTLTAAWSPVDYVVSFDAAGGSAVASQDVTYPAAATEPSEPTREHYTFAGWVDDAGQPWDFGTTITGDTTLSATWTPVDYTVSFTGEGAGIPADATVTYPNPVAEPAAPTLTGHSFTGWVDDADQPWDFGTTVDADTTLRATWAANTYVATFDSAGGSDVTTQDVTYPDPIIAPADPTREHHTFAGWVDDADQPWDFDASIAADTTLTATWTPVDYTVTFDPANGDAVATATVTYPGTPGVPQDPFLSGHTFAGWIHADRTLWDATATVTADTTVTALYTENVRQVSGPGEAGPGDTIEVAGSGFDPGEDVEIELHSTPVTLATVTADATGAFTAQVTIPADAAPGEHELVLTSASGTVSTPFTVAAPASAESDGGPTLASTGPERATALSWMALSLALAGAGLVAGRRRA